MERNIERATELWAMVVKANANHACEVEGCETPYLGVQAHHIFGRNRLSTRTDESNGVALCVNHHVPWAHSKHEEFRAWCIRRMGEGRYTALRQKSEQVHAQPDFDYEIIRLTRRAKALRCVA